MIITYQHASEGFERTGKMLLKPPLRQYALPDHFIIKYIIIICRGRDRRRPKALPAVLDVDFLASAQDHCPTQRLLYEHRSPINEIKVSISQLQHNNSEGRHLETKRTSAKFISSSPGASRLAHVTLHPDSLNKGPSALPNVIFPWISFLINNFLSWVCFSDAGDALFPSPIWLGRIL